MKKFILKILLFFAIVGLCDLCFAYTIEYVIKNAKGGSTKEINDLCYKDEYDILIMGSSQAHHHYVPSIFEDSLHVRVYNAGMDGNGIIYAYGLSKILFERYKPKLVVYNLTPEFDFKIYSNDDKNRRYLVELRKFYNNKEIKTLFYDFDKFEFLKLHSSFYRYNSKFFILLKDFIINDPSINENGYEPDYGIIKKYIPKSYNVNILPNDSVKINYLKKFINYNKSKGIQVVFVSSPKYKEKNSNVFNIIDTLSNDNDLTFINLYSDSVYVHDNKLFKDIMHLNHNGAKVFSRDISSKLKNKVFHD